MPQKFTLYCSQVSGKEPKLVSEDQTQLLKGYNQSEQAFYIFANDLKIDSPYYGFTRWIPKYYGTMELDKIPIIIHNQKVTDFNTKQWLTHLKARYEKRNPLNKFIILENISHHYLKPNVLDIKIGTRNQKAKKHKITQTVNQYLFKLNGCRLTLREFKGTNEDNNKVQPKQDETLFFSKYYCKQVVSREQILEFLAFYFFNGKKLRISVLKSIIVQLKQLILDMYSLGGWKFYSTSVCFFCDVYDDTKSELKLIDFGRSQSSTWLQPDRQSLAGLENILRFLLQISNNHQKIQKKLLQSTQKYRKQQILVVPEIKVKQYQESSSTPNE